NWAKKWALLLFSIAVPELLILKQHSISDLNFYAFLIQKFGFCFVVCTCLTIAVAHIIITIACLNNGWVDAQYWLVMLRFVQIDEQQLLINLMIICLFLY